MTRQRRRPHKASSSTWQRVRVSAHCDEGCEIRFPSWALFGPYRPGRLRLVLCALHAKARYNLEPPGAAFGYNGATDLLSGRDAGSDK